MQSHQGDIEANPDLPVEILLEIAKTLCPEDAVRFFSTSAEVRALVQENPQSIDSFWQQKMQQHFPTDFKQKKNKTGIDWRAAFIKAYEKNYPSSVYIQGMGRILNLTHRQKKLFSIIKEGDLQRFVAGNYSLDDLHLRDASGIAAIDYVNRYNHHAILDYIYEKIATPYFITSNSFVHPMLNFFYNKIATPHSYFTSRNPFDFDKKDTHGLSILHWAVYCKQDAETLQNLISAGFGVNSTSYAGTPLDIAAGNGHLDAVNTLLAQGANMNTARTALHMAAKNGHLAIVNILLAQAANVNAIWTDDTTPLFLAAENGHLDVVKVLLAQGANINAATTDGDTPLHIAACHGHLAIVDVLLTQGAAVDAATTGNWTALHMAARNGHLDTVNALLEQGADVHVTSTYYNQTALHLAARNGHLGIVSALLEQGANVNAAMAHYYHQQTALHIAAINGDLGIVSALLEQGANVNAATDHNETALHVAVYKGHLAVINALLAKGVDVDAVTRSGKTALDIAAQNGHDSITKTLAIPTLSKYIQKRGADTAPEYLNSIRIFGHDFHLGCSKHEKIAAACMLKCVLEGADPSHLQEHEKALGHGELGKIYAAVKNTINRMKSETSRRFTN